MIKRSSCFISLYLMLFCSGQSAVIEAYCPHTTAYAWHALSNDSTSIPDNRIDSLSHQHENELKLNHDAVKLIQFDFVPSASSEHATMKTSPMDKPWMDFQVDLSVPKHMIDTAKVRKPQNYVRMLPYSIWTKFGENPVFDVLVFGNRKRFEIMWQLDLDDFENFGATAIPNAGSYNPNGSAGNASVVIGNLDFIGFLYDNLNKQGRIRKRNRKHANAWKTYQNAAPALSAESGLSTDSVSEMDETHTIGRPGLQHHLKSVELIEEKGNTYFERPDHRLLQTPEQRSRFGTFLDPELYALPTDSTVKHDSLSTESKGKTDLNKSEESQQKRSRRKKTKKYRVKAKQQKKEEDVLKEMPNSMEDLYLYIRTKQKQDSIQRQELFRKDKIDQNVYELEQQQRKLKERQN